MEIGGTRRPGWWLPRFPRAEYYSSVCRRSSIISSIVENVQGDLQRIAGANIRAIRKQRGVSQEQLADALGVHRTYMGGVERGERNLTLRSLERLAERMGVDPVTLLQPPPA